METAETMKIPQKLSINSQIIAHRINRTQTYRQQVKMQLFN